MKEYLKKGLEIADIRISEEIVDKLMLYMEMLKERNKIVNLTAILDDKDIIEKHLIDSLLLTKFMDNDSEGKKAIDIGTGAGFPGMVLAIYFPNIDFVLLDSIGKKTNFLLDVKRELALENVKIVNGRAENFINEENREKYDFGLSRGVSELRILLEYVIPYLKCEGVFLAQKMNYESEIEASKNSFREMNSELIGINEFKLPFLHDRRVILEIIKKNITDKKYPRKAGIPEKRPL